MNFLKGTDVNLTAEYKKVIMQHEQHEKFWSTTHTFQSKSLQGKVSVDGEQVVSLDYAAFTQEFKAWVASDLYLKLGSYGKMCGLKVCLPSPGDVGMLKADIVGGIGGKTLVASLGGVGVAG